MSRYVEERRRGATIERAGLSACPREWPIFLGTKVIGVDVFITVYGEPLEKIAKTAAAARAMRGRHTTWILDDGESDAVP